MQTPPYSALFDQWQNYQKSYLDAWQSMAGSSTLGKLPGNPWTDALEKWWQTFSNQSAPASRELFSMLVEQGKTFFNMASTLDGSLSEAMKTQSNGGDWEKVISKSFDGLRDSLAAGASSMPMELWRKFVIERFQSPGDLIPDFVKQLQDNRNQILSMPAIGQSREKQELLQKLAKEVSEYQIACGAYMEVQAKIGNLSVDLLQKKVVEKFNNKDYPESYRAIYDLWVDCYEEVYTDAVMQPEYNKAYSDMVNSLMSMTLTYRGLQDDTLEAYGMPSRRELDTLHRRFQEERRQKQIMRTEIETLKEQINQLTERTQAAS
ncbi:MAG: class III poly(R)-hydroxyalkanoic acid synthase subunit PhaE, partial [Methylococcales bacterium]